MKMPSPAPALTVMIGLFMIASSLVYVSAKPERFPILPFWEASLLAGGVLLAAYAAYLIKTNTARRSALGQPKRSAILITDILFTLAAFVIIITGRLNPATEIEIGGMSATFGFEVLMPFLVLTAGLIMIKDAINLLYGYGPKGREVLAFSLVRLSAALALIYLGAIIAFIAYKGIGAIGWEFLTQPPCNLGQNGGISTVIEGTFWMVLISMLISSPLGIGAAIYLNEYSKNVRLKRIITIAVGCLNGVPSVVYGLFGLALLVSTFGISLISGAVILGLMNLPTIILTSQEALKSVPLSLREGSVALGASRWQTIKKVVLPPALPGVLTGLIIGVARATGETAPIMWTAVTFTAAPVHKYYGIVPDLTQPVNNLCYHLLNLIYFLGAWDVEQRAWGTALVLLALVLSVNLLAVLVRNHYRKKISW